MPLPESWDQIPAAWKTGRTCVYPVLSGEDMGPGSSAATTTTMHSLCPHISQAHQEIAGFSPTCFMVTMVLAPVYAARPPPPYLPFIDRPLYIDISGIMLGSFVSSAACEVCRITGYHLNSCPDAARADCLISPLKMIWTFPFSFPNRVCLSDIRSEPSFKSPSDRHSVMF